MIVATAVIIYLFSTFTLNFTYPEAQVFLFPLFILPLVIGWIGWAQLYTSTSYEIVELFTNIYKALILVFILLHVERLLGWIQANDKNLFSEEKFYNALCNPDVQRGWRCIKFKNFETSLEAKQYVDQIKIAVYQSPVIMFIIAIVGTVVIENESDWEDEVMLILRLIRVVSVIVAIVALFSMVFFVNKLPEMKGLGILLKLVVVKFGIVFADVQPLIIQFLATENLITNKDKHSTDDITEYTQSLFICCEMIILAVLLAILFPASDYRAPPDPKSSKTYN